MTIFNLTPGFIFIIGGILTFLLRNKFLKFITLIVPIVVFFF